MNSRRKHPPAIAGAKAGFSTAIAYRFEKDPRLPSQKKTRRERRRADPLAEVWNSEAVPLLKVAPGLRPIAIFEELCRRHPDLRAERGGHWNVASGFGRRERAGPGGDLPPGSSAGPECAPRSGRSRRHHRRPEPRRPALSLPLAVLGLRTRSCRARRRKLRRVGRRAANALWALGGVPEQHRTDSLSAAFRNLNAEAKEDLTTRYEAFCAYYGMTPTCNIPGVSPENGSIETSHGHLKSKLERPLAGASRDFETLLAWRGFVDEIVGPHGSNAKRIDQSDLR